MIVRSATDKEVRALRQLAEALDPIIDRLGDQPDAVYIQDPAWQNVVDRAASALKVFQHEDPESR
ncbi:MAG: SCO4402 family protein [Pseudonocardiaceae bacterium]